MLRRAVVLAAGLLLAACATTGSKPPKPAPNPAPAPVPKPEPRPAPQPEPPPRPSIAFADLPGWDSEDHAAALAAYRAGCGADKSPAGQEVCRRAKAAGALDEAGSRYFIETHFRIEPAGDPGQTGLLTAYYSPEYEARFSRQDDFTVPVRPRPDDLVDGKPYPERAEIEARDEPRPLAWMRPEEFFFLQIQGSGTLVLPGGTRKRAIFTGTNGRPFKGIATPMRDQGLLSPDNTSGGAILDWLAEHRGPEADAIMALNPRFVFFRLADDDGAEPAGAAGIPLPAGRAIAIDPSRHGYGELYWISAEAPSLTGAFPTYRRAVMALDTGGAIKGDIRADLYIGRGRAAGLEAGRVKHSLRLYRLVPILSE
ncbi:membrane-bound lytic murein transglycosylase A [Caulobacter ginsengisoli]|uniref:peptidoglycan lytic exotransglycosylase n=1 Tax=Caulobacter ginsengisoli TaxID=400775 RepID=A0ABU0ITE1_9CAUL|nr:MltA domain-containing protein [Caulobacter ginsengisoli]MDQ0465260.1 membrane-bound lytic murein transglycosylase A [Caulobacter ginsengisoli]